MTDINGIRTPPLHPHHEIGETFADSASSVSFDGGTLRLTFAVTRILEPTTGKGLASERHVVARVVLAGKGAADLLGQMQTLAAQLIKSGALKARESDDPVQ